MGLRWVRSLGWGEFKILGVGGNRSLGGDSLSSMDMARYRV